MKKDYRFQILYALGIIFVLAGHGGGGINLFYDWFPPYSFHLGLFMFISGYFYKKESENNLKKYTLKKIKRLLLPLFLWNIFYAIITELLSTKGFEFGIPNKNLIEKLLILPIINGHQFGYNLGGWFVIPLFMVQMYYVFFRKIVGRIFKNKHEWGYFILHLILGIVGIYLAMNGYRDGWWLCFVRMLIFIPFYSLGILYKNKLEQKDNLSSTKYFSIIFIINILILFIYKTIPSYTVSTCNDFINFYIPYIVGFVGIAFWLRIATLIEPIMGRNKYVNLIANNTYSIMINHLMSFMVLKTFFAIICKYTTILTGFDWVQYKTNIFYIYLPYGITQFGIFYLMIGLLLPIAMQLILNKLYVSIKYKINKCVENNTST